MVPVSFVYIHAVRSCEPLGAIVNGNVSIDVGQPVDGAIATYQCNAGYRLNNDCIRLCQGSGLWNGTKPVCLGEPRRNVNSLTI